jgi:hypothetical protein
MTDCLAVSLTPDGYEFTDSDKGEIHLFQVTETTNLRTILIEESSPVKVVLEKVGIEDYYVETPLGGSGEIGLHIGQLDAFLDGADRSPYSLTVAEEVKAYIEEDD